MASAAGSREGSPPTPSPQILFDKEMPWGGLSGSKLLLKSVERDLCRNAKDLNTSREAVERCRISQQDCIPSGRGQVAAFATGKRS